MRLVITAVGRLKSGPERELAERYRDRSVRIGRGLGIREIEIIEIRESRARETERRVVEEGVAVATVIPEGAALAVLDPRGDNVTSEGLAARRRSDRNWRRRRFRLRSSCTR